MDARTSSLSLPLIFPFSSESSCSGGGFFLSSANVTASTLSSSMARICRLSACAEGPCTEGSFFRGIMAPHATLSGVTWAQSHMRGRVAVVVAALESGGRAPGRGDGQLFYSRPLLCAHFPLSPS